MRAHQADAELVASACAGTQDAFAAIYDRYADRIHGFCCSLLRDADLAADATQDTFVVAATRLGQLRDPSRLKAWLYAIARNEATRHGRARSRTPPTGAVVDVASDTAGPDELASRRDASVVWEAAAGLSERDRTLLELSVRQGLEGRELADAAGTTVDHAYVLVSRLRDQVERSLGALLVARHGRRDCDELQAMLRAWDGRFTPLVRKRVARHVDGCPRCRESRKALASPLALLAGVPLVPAPAELRARVLEEVRLHLVSHTAPAPVHGRGRWRADGFPPALVPSSRRRPGALLAAAAVLVVLGAFVAGRGGGAPTQLANRGGGLADAVPQDAAGAGAAAGGPVTELAPVPVAGPAGAAVDPLAPPVGEGPPPAAGPALPPPPAGPGGAPAAPSPLPAPAGPALGPAPAPATPGTPAPPAPPPPAPPASAVPPTAAPTTSPTTAAPPAPAPAPTTPPPPPPAPPPTSPPAPGQLVLDTTAVNLGPTAASGPAQLRNAGGQALTWTATPGAGWLSASPASGTLAPGASSTLTVGIDRGQAPEGNLSSVVTVRSGSFAGTITVSASVARPPAITGVSAGATRLAVRGCGTSTTPVRADVTDESALSTVELVVNGPDGTVRLPMARAGGTTWTATLGPFSRPGTATWQVVATDANRATAASPIRSTPIDACPAPRAA